MMKRTRTSSGARATPKTTRWSLAGRPLVSRHNTSVLYHRVSATGVPCNPFCTCSGTQLFLCYSPPVRCEGAPQELLRRWPPPSIQPQAARP